MPGKLQLEVVTPERRVLSVTTEFVALPGVNGQFGVLFNHAPLIAGLTIGIIRYGTMHGAQQRLFVSGGLAEIVDNRITVLADVAEREDEIDVARAKAAKERAERRLRSQQENIDMQRAELALQRALTRLRIAAGRHE